MQSNTRLALLTVFVVLTLGFSVAPIVNYFHGGRNKDYPLWYAVGQKVLCGDDLYPRDGTKFWFMYPPPAALLLAPLSGLGRLPMVAALLLLNSAAWATTVLLSVRLAAGRAFGQHHALYLVPSALCVFYVHDIYLLGQPNLLLLALLLGAFACLRTGRERAAGLLVALAAVIKAFPVLVLPYLVYRRHWRALVWAVAGLAALLVLAPAPFRGFQRNLDELGVWAGGMVFRYDADAIGQRPAQGYGFKNQSLIAVAHRLLRPVNAEAESDPAEVRPVYVNVADLDFRTVTLVVVVAALGLGLFFVWSMPPHGQRTAGSDAVEFAMLIVLVLMSSPYTFVYYFVWLIYPFTVVVNLALTAASRRERNRTVAWFASILLLLALAQPFLYPRVPQALGNSFWACLLLLVCLGLQMRRRTTISAPELETLPAPKN